MSLRVKRITTAALTIAIAIPPENPEIKGSFTAHAVIRSKPENTKFFDEVNDGKYDDEQIIRALFTGFDGIENESGPCTGEAAFEEVLRGDLSAWLTPAAIEAYYAQYGEARRKNSKRSR